MMMSALSPGVMTRLPSSRWARKLGNSMAPIFTLVISRSSHSASPLTNSASRTSAISLMVGLSKRGFFRERVNQSNIGENLSDCVEEDVALAGLDPVYDHCKNIALLFFKRLVKRAHCIHDVIQGLPPPVDDG